MNPKSNPEVTAEALLALRKETDAVRLISEQLRVKEMGPADHIRTKHEVKAFVESGDAKTAEALLQRARERATSNQSVTNTITQQQKRGQRVAE